MTKTPEVRRGADPLAPACPYVRGPRSGIEDPTIKKLGGCSLLFITAILGVLGHVAEQEWGLIEIGDLLQSAAGISSLIVLASAFLQSRK